MQRCISVYMYVCVSIHSYQLDKYKAYDCILNTHVCIYTAFVTFI